MYHPPSKKKQIATRFIVSGIMTLSVILLVTILVFLLLGYRFDSKDGELTQVGFMQYDTVPNGATVEVDGETLSGNTPTKGSVLPGTHEFVMWDNGYETWRKSLTIASGTLTWLDYARLIPKERPVESVISVDSLSDSLASPGGRFMIAQTAPSAASFVLFDLRDGEDVTQETLTLPADIYSQAEETEVNHQFRLMEWDQSGRYVLVEHRYDDASEWLVVDTEDITETTNVSESLNVDIDEAHLSGTNGSILYAKTGGDVRKLDLLNGTISRPLASNVDSFSLYGSNTVSYVTLPSADEPKQRTVGVVTEGDERPLVLRTVTNPDVSLEVATTRYFDQDYVVIAEGKKIEVLRGDYPTLPEDLKTSLRLYAEFEFSRDVQWLDISDNGRFVLVQTGDRFTSYDLERMTLAPEATLAGEGASRELQWLDNYYVWSDRSGQIAMREFDGANQHMINDVVPGFDATLSTNNEFLYSIGKTEDGFQLQRVKLIL